MTSRGEVPWADRGAPPRPDTGSPSSLVTRESLEETAINTDEEELCYTVEEAVEKAGFGFFQIMLTTFCGVMRIADAMEMMLLSVISPAVRCQWGLSTFEQAFITTVVFFGFFIGGLFWGSLCDRIGRRKGLFLVTVNLLVCGMLSALPVTRDPHAKFPNYHWLLLCRFGVGIGAGGSCQCVSYYIEFLPTKSRGPLLILNGMWWPVGAVFGGLLTWLVMEPLGWRCVLFFSSLPLGFVLVLFIFVPESAQFYMTKGENGKAMKVMETVAHFNGKILPKGSIVTAKEKDRRKGVLLPRGSISHTLPTPPSSEEPESENGTDEGVLFMRSKDTGGCWSWIHSSLVHNFQIYSSFFKGEQRTTTVLLLFIWIGCPGLYFGIILLTTSFLHFDTHCGQSATATGSVQCKELNKEDYTKIVWTSIAEIPGLLIAMFMIEWLGRKKAMSVQFLAAGVSFLLLLICAGDSLLTLFLFIIRAFVTGAFQTIYVYTPEVYPTAVRGAAIGLHTSVARIGAMITPFVAQVLLPISDYATILLYTTSALLLAILSSLLPIETKGRSLN